MWALRRLRARASGCAAWPGGRVPWGSARGLHSSSPARRQTVAVALSGGVDSAVAAMLLRRQGHEVVGVFMRNWDEAEELGAQRCSAEADLRDARRVARHLGVPLHTADFVADYWHTVFAEFVEQCGRGLTPNPDLPCNRHIKFDALLRFAAGLGTDAVATGHYARLRPDGEGGQQLLRGVDAAKDQSYFLASVRPGAFARVLFPLGQLTKAQVRALAAEAGLPNAGRRSSAGICFIGKRKFSDFLAGYAAPLRGSYVSVDTRELLGECASLAGVTYGQRAPLGGSAARWVLSRECRALSAERVSRLFVAGKDMPGRRVWLAPGTQHPALLTRAALLRQASWLAGRPPPALAATGSLGCSYMARHRQPLQACTLSLDGGGVQPSCFTRLLPEDWPGADAPGTLALRFAAPARAITPQQACVLYAGEVCLGAAPVLCPGRTLHETEQPTA